MTLLKRLLTSAALFLPSFIVIYFGICMVGGGIAGGRSAINNPDAENKTELSRQAGADFVRNNLETIVLASLGISFVGSLGLSFSGILPWCRKPQEPPMMPGAGV